MISTTFGKIRDYDFFYRQDTANGEEEARPNTKVIWLRVPENHDEFGMYNARTREGDMCVYIDDTMVVWRV
jgi:hypothetical protein